MRHRATVGSVKAKDKIEDLRFDGEVAFERLRRFGRIILSVRKDSVLPPTGSKKQIEKQKSRGKSPLARARS
jgi:hypothetical protein